MKPNIEDLKNSTDDTSNPRLNDDDSPILSPRKKATSEKTDSPPTQRKNVRIGSSPTFLRKKVEKVDDADNESKNSPRTEETVSPPVSKKTGISPSTLRRLITKGSHEDGSEIGSPRTAETVSPVAPRRDLQETRSSLKHSRKSAKTSDDETSPQGSRRRQLSSDKIKVSADAAPPTPALERAAKVNQERKIIIDECHINFTEYEAISNRLYKYYCEALGHLKKKNLSEFLKTLCNASSYLFAMLATKMPNLNFVDAYSSITQHFMKIATYKYQADTSAIIPDDMGAYFLLMEVQLEHVFLESIVQDRFCAELLVIENPNERESQLTVGYFLAKAMVHNFIPTSIVLTPELFGQYEEGIANKRYPVGLTHESMDDLIVTHATHNPKISTSVKEKILQHLRESKQKLENRKPSLCNFFMKSTVEKAAQIALLIQSINTEDKTTQIRNLLQAIISNKKIQEHRNVFLRCAARLFNIRPPTIVQELNETKTLVPDLLFNRITLGNEDEDTPIVFGK